MATTLLRLKTDVDIIESDGRATFSIWLNNEAEAYTLRVDPLTADEILDDEEPAYRFAVRDGYTGNDNLYRTWDEAVSAAWDFYTETQAQYFNQARGID